MKINFIDKITKTKENEVIIKLITKDFFEKNKCENLEKNYNFKASYNEKVIVCCENKLKVVVGLGEEEDLDNKKLEELGENLFKYFNSNKFKNVVLFYNTKKDSNELPESSNNLLSILKGIELSNYRFDKYMAEDKKEKIYLENINLLVKDVEKLEQEYKDFLLVKENIFFCRDLVNEPANIINPATYADLCSELNEYGLEVEVFGEDEMSNFGMGSLLSVGQGSDCESRFVVLKWQGLEEFKDPIAFVGKGITFDSGGLSLKPDNAMLDMKCDMAGSAVVVSLLKLLAQRKARVNAVGVVALVENMPSGNATKVGDIIESMSGQTIEILNTDAEGRLILADELYYAISKFKPQTVIDLATLTGAICVALGEINAGLFTNNDELAEEIWEATENTGELTWRMPLDKIGSKYDRMMDSSVADVKNISGTRYAGSITAAQFLQRFIDGHNKWAHIDIAGTAFVEKAGYFVKEGATGFGVRLLNDLVKNHYEK